MLENISNSISVITAQTAANYPILLTILVIIWGVFILSRILPIILLLGIIPRKPYGLAGIIFAPLLHLNFNHVFFNTIPLIVLANFLLIDGLPYFLNATVFITIVSGILIWIFAKPGIHLGASSLITGFWALLVTDIYQQGTLTAIIIGIVSLYYFVGIFLGIFPSKKGVSWEGHLFGLVAGVLFAFYT